VTQVRATRLEGSALPPGNWIVLDWSFPVVWKRAERRQKDASLEVHGRAEGIQFEAG
jgi:hypothetical protein